MNDAKAELRTRRLKFYLRCISIACYIISVICLIDIVLEILGHSGILFQIWKCFTSRLPPILNIESVKSVATAVGLGSFFITWVYGDLGKEQLGLSYHTLLSSLHNHYNSILIIHVISILACFWTTSSNALECAILSLLIALLCILFYLIVLVGFSLNSDILKHLAIEHWKNQFSSYFKHPDGVPLVELHRLETSISIDDNTACGKLLNLRNESMINYYNHKKDNSRMGELVMSWRNLLSTKTDVQQRVLIKNSLRELESKRDEEFLSYEAICASYIAFRYQALLSEDCLDESRSKLMEKLYTDIFQVEAEEKTKNLLASLYRILLWYHFCEGITVRFSNLLIFPQSKQATICYQKPRDFYKAFVEITIGGDYNDASFGVAWEQCKIQSQQEQNAPSCSSLEKSPVPAT